MTLIDRLSKLDGPDREADAMLYCFQHGHTYSRKYGNDYAMWVKGVPHEVKIIDLYLDKFTASVDAALALADRLYPGTEYEFTNLYNIVRVTIEMNGKYGGFHGEHVNSLPIAICIALLRAKEASDASN